MESKNYDFCTFEIICPGLLEEWRANHKKLSTIFKENQDITPEYDELYDLNLELFKTMCKLVDDSNLVVRTLWDILEELNRLLEEADYETKRLYGQKIGKIQRQINKKDLSLTCKLVSKNWVV